MLDEHPQYSVLSLENVECCWGGGGGGGGGGGRSYLQQIAIVTSYSKRSN